jgi:hypothetical protein
MWNRCGLDALNIGLINTDRLADHSLSGFDLTSCKKVFVVGTGGFANRIKIRHPHVHYFDSTLNPRQQNLHTHFLILEYSKSHYVNWKLANELKNVDEKINCETLFDVLLGLFRLHREFIYDWINNSPNKHKFFMTYYKTEGNWQGWQPGYFEGESQPFVYSGDMLKVNERGDRWMLSQILPVKIFNETIYSIVTETDHVRPSIPTEKTWKPMIARRLFVMFANAGFLCDLRSQGFKTFDGIIDESYDLIENDHERWSRAMQQCEWLCAQDPLEIMKQCNDIVEHNYAMVMQDYNQKFIDLVQQIAQQE